jgi:histidyl-tRNA synthetase
LLTELLTRLAVTDTQAHINSLGCPDCRPGFKAALTAFLDGQSDQLCADCIRRKDRNPLRVLDCKVPTCRQAMVNAPAIIDYLCPVCKAHFETVKTQLTALDVPFTVDKRLVRGLDYYTRTTFEIQTGALGAQSAVAGGGRYDGLVKMLGGPDTPATGFAIGFDRLAEIVDNQQAGKSSSLPLFIAALGDQSQALAFQWACRLALDGIEATMDYEGRSLKSQMKRADRMQAQYVLIVGDEELENGAAILRNMATKEQTEVPLDDPVQNIIALIKA